MSTSRSKCPIALICNEGVREDRFQRSTGVEKLVFLLNGKRSLPRSWSNWSQRDSKVLLIIVVSKGYCMFSYYENRTCIRCKRISRSPSLQTRAIGGNNFIFENGTDVGKQFYYVSPERIQLFNSAVKSIK